MNVLVLGGTGMLGHEFARQCALRHRVIVTVRESAGAGLPGVPSDRIVPGVDAARVETVARAIRQARPDVVINCIGIIKQLKEAKSPLISIQVNALFPHQLFELCRAQGARLIHISTDCVFSGKKGSYKETDEPDPVDLYGKTKLLGEIVQDGALTVRTSMIGRQLRGRESLLEWFLSQPHRGEIRGFAKAVFSGLTTTALSRVLLEVISRHRRLSGLYHVSSQPIDKLSLLRKLQKHFGLKEMTITSDLSLRCDRSLDSALFRKKTGIRIPSWDEMIAEIPGEATV